MRKDRTVMLTAFNAGFRGVELRRLDLPTNERPAMPTQDDIDDMLQRVAMAALAYYPEVTTDEPGYLLEEDVSWCLEPLPNLSSADLTDLALIVGQAITDPTQHRQALFGAVLELLPD